MGFCFILNLTTTCIDGKWVYGHQILLSMLVLLPTLTLGSKHLLQLKRLISNTA